MKKSLLALLVCSCVSTYSFATDSQNNIAHSSSVSPFSIGVYGGYGVIDGAYDHDGDVAQGRLSLGYQFANYKSVLFGAELGAQSGNTMRLNDSATVDAALGGLPVQATLKPIVDLLFTVKGQFSANSPLYGILKAGIAYRQLQLNDRTSSQDTLRKVNGELQLGLGYKLSENAMITLYYQGIYSNSSAGVSVDAAANYTYVSHIPTQQAGFLGVEYSL